VQIVLIVNSESFSRKVREFDEKRIFKLLSKLAPIQNDDLCLQIKLPAVLYSIDCINLHLISWPVAIDFI
jgi:hypothetical protein